MTLRYRYRLIPASQAVAPLGGRWVRPRPLALVSLVGPTSTYGEAGKLDTGSDDTIFPEKAAGMVGVDLRQAATGEARVVGMGLVPLRYAQVTLRLTQGSERREWPAWVGFTPAWLKYPLLGFAGCLQFFTATFLGDREEVELTVNSLYPGT